MLTGAFAPFFIALSSCKTLYATGFCFVAAFFCFIAYHLKRDAGRCLFVMN